MSQGPGRLEAAIAELFSVNKDPALSVGDICDHAFTLGGRPASRAQRLSATGAAHQLRRAAAASSAVEMAFEQAADEASVILGRDPGGRGHGELTLFLFNERVVASTSRSSRCADDSALERRLCLRTVSAVLRDAYR